MVVAVNVIDLIIGLLLMALVPVLCRTYLSGPRVSKDLASKVALIGILWLAFALVSEEFMEAVFSFERADSYRHEAVAEALAMGRLPEFWDEMPTGNRAYQVFVYVLFLLGAYVPSARVINAFCALWGGLALAGNLKEFTIGSRHGNSLLLLVIFFPSTVFWCSANMKEGLVYWAICMMLSTAFQGSSRKNFITPVLLASVVVGGFLRPHVIMAWMIAICAVMFFTRGRRVYALITLAVLPILFLKMQALAQDDISSLDDAVNILETRGRGLMQGGSRHTGEMIPVVGGLIAILFRPFPWEARSLFMMTSAIEIWFLSLLMFRSWLKLTRTERRYVWRVPATKVALLSGLIISVLFSYLPNDGLLARQRVQVVPALMVLTVIPLCMREHLRFLRRLRTGPWTRQITRAAGSPGGAPDANQAYPVVNVPQNKGHPKENGPRPDFT